MNWQEKESKISISFFAWLDGQLSHSLPFADPSWPIKMRGEEVNSTEISEENHDHDDDGHEPDHGDDVDDDSDDG